MTKFSSRVEYKAMAYLTRKFVWLKQLMTKLSSASAVPMKLYYNNQVALHISSNLGKRYNPKRSFPSLVLVTSQLKSKLVTRQNKNIQRVKVWGFTLINSPTLTKEIDKSINMYFNKLIVLQHQDSLKHLFAIIWNKVYIDYKCKTYIYQKF